MSTTFPRVTASAAPPAPLWIGRPGDASLLPAVDDGRRLEDLQAAIARGERVVPSYRFDSLPTRPDRPFATTFALRQFGDGRWLTTDTLPFDP